MELSEIYTCLKELSFYNHNEVLTGVAILVSLYAIKKTVDLSRKESNNRIIKLKYDSILQLMIFADDISLEINRIEQEEKELKEMLNKIESKIKESNDDYLLKIKNDILSWTVSSKLTNVNLLEMKSNINFLLNRLGEEKKNKVLTNENHLTTIKNKLPVEKYNFEKLAELTEKRRKVIKEAKEIALDNILNLI